MPASVSTTQRPAGKQRRSLRSLLRPIDELARGSDHFFAAHVGYSDSSACLRAFPGSFSRVPGKSEATFVSVYLREFTVMR